MSNPKKSHVVCVPFPAQGHITPMLKLAKLIYFKGVNVTFVNTEFNHRRFVRSRGSNSLDGLPGFRFQTIPDGLPPSDADATQDIPSLLESTFKNCLAPFSSLISKLNSDGPPVTCIVGDVCMGFGVEAAKQFGIPIAIFMTNSSCSTLVAAHFGILIERGYIPLKDVDCLTNGYLETTIDWIHGMGEMRLKDLPSFIRTTDPNDVTLKLLMDMFAISIDGTAIILNTFDDLEQDVVEAVSRIYPRVFSIGPLQMLVEKMIKGDDPVQSIQSSLWKEDVTCMEWLNTRDHNSVVYVNFGSITMLSIDQLVEFAWGLANSKKSFLWIVRSDMVTGELAILPEQFFIETKERGMLANWCPQEDVLKHRAIAGFLTHCGWNSTLESISCGVPMLCWPFFADQQTNCKYCCVDWGIGMEIDNDVKRDEVEMLVRKVIDGEKAKEMKRRVMELKDKAEEATEPEGSSFGNFDKLLKEIILFGN